MKTIDGVDVRRWIEITLECSPLGGEGEGRIGAKMDVCRLVACHSRRYREDARCQARFPVLCAQNSWKPLQDLVHTNAMELAVVMMASAIPT